MTLEQLNKGNIYLKAMEKATKIKNIISNYIYNVEKGNGIDMNMILDALNEEDKKYLNADNNTITIQPFSFILNSTNDNESTDIDLLRHIMGAMERATEYFKKKIEEI